MIASRLMALVGSLALAASLGCAEKKAKTYGDGGEEESAGGVSVAPVGGQSSSRSQLLTIPVQLSSRSFELLGSATTFTIVLEDCASEYTSTADEGSTALQVYKYDRGCKAKLTTFSYNGKTYLPTAADGFTDYAEDDTATFDEAGEPGTDAVSVKVVSQLGDVVSENDSVIYHFSELHKGVGTTMQQAAVSDGHQLFVESDLPPSFKVASAELVSIAADGTGSFDLKLECTAAIVSANGVDSCVDVDISTLRYKLVDDTYNGTLVIDDAQALFPAVGDTSTAVTARAGYLLPAGGDLVNGGFATVTLTGPAEMANNKEMIFIIKAGTMSYQYFNVVVATLIQD